MRTSGAARTTPRPWVTPAATPVAASSRLPRRLPLLRRNLRRSLRYITYAPIETVSNYFNNFAKSLQEIEE